MKYLLLSFLLFAIACNSTQESTGTMQSDSAANVVSSSSEQAKVELVAEKPVLDSTETPHATVKLLVNNQAVWQKQVTGDWNNFEKDQYKAYNIPENAVAAYQSWWAGAGDLFYLIQENGKWVVKSCEMGESEGDSEEEITYEYKTEKEVPVQ